jgi:putative effector of murein hydrolase
MRPFIYKLFGLKTPAGRGVGIGSASHAMGTADSMTRNEEEGSFSTIAMGLSALIVSFIAPILVMVFL